MKHFASARFWALYNALPAEVRALTDKNYAANEVLDKVASFKVSDAARCSTRTLNLLGGFMKGTGFVGVALLIFSATFDVAAADWKTLKGTYAVTPKNYLDPAEDEPKDSHLRVQLSGETAKELYSAMKVDEKPDECTGATAKQVGAMQCLFYKSEKKYACHFAIDVMQQKIEYGVAC